jgi:hypothetical protein
MNADMNADILAQLPNAITRIARLTRLSQPLARAGTLVSQNDSGRAP